MRSIAHAKRLIGWLPNQPPYLPHCRECRHAGLVARASDSYMDCTRHGFMTFGHATCSSHTPATPDTPTTEEPAA